MKLAVLKEQRAHETRVAASADSVKKLTALGFAVSVEKGAGHAAHISDDNYEAAGATVTDATAACRDAAVLLSVAMPSDPVLSQLPQGCLVIGMLSPYENAAAIAKMASGHLTAFAMELMPRISRAQSMDTLSSQSNLAGYRAVIDGMHALTKAAPMMMTAAGTVAPAKVLVLGAGVAGLQAIATAKRLGAVVSAFDVRPAVKEQVESLGAKFIEVKDNESASAETSGGYAKEMSEDYKKRQAELLMQTLSSQDLVITTALIPGKRAPLLITETMLAGMKPGSVVVDMAVASGGNCASSQPDQTVEINGVTILGDSNPAARVAKDASSLYARNLLTFLTTLLNKEGQLVPNFDDELVKGTLLTHAGEILKSFNPS